MEPVVITLETDCAEELARLVAPDSPVMADRYMTTAIVWLLKGDVLRGKGAIKAAMKTLLELSPDIRYEYESELGRILKRLEEE